MLVIYLLYVLMTTWIRHRNTYPLALIRRKEYISSLHMHAFSPRTTDQERRTLSIVGKMHPCPITEAER